LNSDLDVLDNTSSLRMVP